MKLSNRNSMAHMVKFLVVARVDPSSILDILNFLRFDFSSHKKLTNLPICLSMASNGQLNCEISR